MAPAERLDPRAIRAALADPLAVARALGLEKGARRGGGGLLVRCPAHGDRTPSMSLRVGGDGTVSAHCYACSWPHDKAGGDLFDLVACVDGLDVRRDFALVLERAAELAGGFVRATCKEPLRVRPEALRLPEDVAADIFARICKVRPLRARGAVEAYIERRGLLDAAREDGWATLPSLDEMLDVARGMCNESPRRETTAIPVNTTGGKPSDAERALNATDSLRHYAPGAFAFGEGRRVAQEASQAIADGRPSGWPSTILGPEELLIAAKLARRDREGRLRVMYGRHRLVIPWRGPDGRIQALQRRLIDKPRVWQGQEDPRYVLTWAPRWPYGVERLASGIARRLRGAEQSAPLPPVSAPQYADTCYRTPGSIHEGSSGDSITPVIFVEGGVDALAMRLLRPGRCSPLGLPGTGAWESSWAGLVGQREAFYGTDSDASGDERAAQAAIDVAENQGRLPPHEAAIARQRLRTRLDYVRRVRDELKAGKCTQDEATVALAGARCVLCGVEAELLCRGCGRVRARGKDWGEVWEKRPKRPA